jgi:raffinose/stachyose/melibiose transport system substrate-binding protein
MKLRLAASLAALVVTMGSLAACGGSSGSSGGDSKAKTLVVYSADPANAKTYQTVLDKFGTANGVTVKLISYPSADFLKNFASAVQGKSQADVLFANGQDVRYLKSKSLLGDVSGLVDSSTLVPAAVTPFTIDGKQYAYGTGTLSTCTFIYNTALFDKYKLTVPKTLDDLKADADKLKGTGVSLISVPGQNIYLWPIWLMATLQQTTSDKPSDTTASTLQSNNPPFTDPVYVKALDAMSQLGKAGVFANGYNGVTEDAAVAAFVQQKAAMYYGGSWDLSTIAQQGSKLDLKAIPFPNFVPGVTSKPTGGVGIAVGTYGHVDPSRNALARKLVTYMASTDVDTQLVAGNTGALSLPAGVGVKSGTTSALQTQLVNDYVPNTFTFLDWYWPKEVTSAVQNGVQAVVAGKQTPEAAAKAISDAFAAAKQGGWSYS